MIRDPLFYLLLPGLVAPVFINTSVFFHQVAVCQAKGWSPEWFVASYPFSSAMNICSTLLVGWLLDRVGTRPVLAMLLLPQLLALLLLGTSDHAIVIPIYLTLAGATMGTVQPFQSAVLAEIYGTGYFGEVRAVVTSSNVLMGALGPALIGLLVDRGVTFDQAFLGMALYTLIATALLFAAGVVMKRTVLNCSPKGLTSFNPSSDRVR
jgi:MFS family permease